jgi:hypothetical protein
LRENKLPFALPLLFVWVQGAIHAKKQKNIKNLTKPEIYYIFAVF